MFKIKLNKIENSSNIDYVGYSFEKKTLIVCFKGYSFYQYSNIPQEIYEGLLLAESKGKYLNEFIKNSFKVYRKLEHFQAFDSDNIITVYDAGESIARPEMESASKGE